MSLKNIILKTGAASIAVSILFSNCSMFGLGLSKVIAENLKAPEIEANLTSQKYVQYQTEEYSGVALQTEVEVNSIQEQEGYLPVSSTNLEVKLPNINGHLPERASVVKASTEATTGEKENTRINQNYDSNSGLLTVSYENIQNSDGNIYTEFKKDAKDKFEIIYIYPAEAYTGNEEEVALQYTVNAKMAFKTENEKITSEKTKSFELKEKENKGDITTFNVTELKENIYKGFMYSNVENKTNYDTEYKTVSTLCVLNSQFVNETTMELKESKFVLNDKEETEATTNGKVVYKSTGISKAEFDKILGQDGSLEIYNGETLIATVKYIEVEENKKTVKKLAVVYSEEDVKILTDEEISAIVEYKEDVTALTIKTSKPIAEGFMNFENQNTIKAAKDYGVDVKDIKYIRVATNVNTYESKTDIQLSEPETKISVNSSNTNFSTLQTSKTTLTIKLDDTNASTKLFDNPTITIKLPNGLTGGKLSSPEILNGNGLSIKSAKADNNVITIELEGKQTSYDLNNVSGGVNIVMDIENIDFNDKTPTHKDKIEVDCVQGSNKVTTSCDVNINSKFGLLMLSETTGYDSNNNITTNTDSQIKEISISDNEQAKEVVQALTLVNNYGEDLSNIQIIGRIGYTNGAISSTFDTNLTKPITINKEGAKVYYSNNKEASYDDNSWTEEFTINAKSYKVVLKNNKLSKMETATIKIYVQVPEKLGYNQATYLRTEANYIYNNQNRSDSSTIKMETAKVEEKDISSMSAMSNYTETSNSNLQVAIYVTAGGQLVNEGDEVYEGQTLKTKLTLKNNASTDVTYILDTMIENAVYYELYETGNIVNNEEGAKANIYKEGEQGDVNRKKEINIPANSSIYYEYQYVVNKNVQKVINRINILDNNNKVIDEIKIENKVKPAKIKLLFSYSYNEENLVYGTMNTVLNIKNYESKDLKDITLKVNLSKQLSPDSFENYGDEKIEMTYDDVNNIMEIHIDKLLSENSLQILIIYNVSIDTNLLSETVSLNAVCEYDGETYLSNDFSKIAYQNKSDLKMVVSNNLKTEKVEVGNNIQYTVNITNSGKLDLNDSVMIFKPSNGIKVNSAYIVYSDGTKKAIEVDMNSVVSTNFDIRGTDNINIIYNVTVDYTLENMENIFILSDPHWNKIMNTSILNGIIESDIKEEKDEDEYIINKDNTDDNIEQNPNDKDNTDDNIEQNPNDKDNNDNNQDNNQNNTQEHIYTISGIAWLDSNKDGQRNNDEKLMDSVIVSLVNKDTGNFAIDDSGNKITAITNSNGEYKFENVKEGNYLVLFEFDTNTYTVTTYQKTNIEQNLNSDAIITTITINGEKKLAGITDNITLNSNKENVDIGLIENATFDLSLDKQITKVTVTNSQGTQEFKYEDGETAKVDLVAKYINTATVIVNYKFTITNNGDTVGYVDSLVDNLPSGLEFSSELNKDWYKGSDGQLYTTSLSGIAIKPGESTQVELILTKNMTENNTGTFVNNAELEKISNLENIQEKTEALENNESSAILILSIKTGSVMLYTGITVACVLILAAGAYIIKKKILDKEI